MNDADGWEVGGSGLLKKKSHIRKSSICTSSNSIFRHEEKCEIQRQN